MPSTSKTYYPNTKLLKTVVYNNRSQTVQCTLHYSENKQLLSKKLFLIKNQFTEREIFYNNKFVSRIELYNNPNKKSFTLNGIITGSTTSGSFI